MPNVRDSLDKIFTTHFAGLTREVLVWRGEEIRPKALRISPGIFRGYTCPTACGGCCFRVTLDYIPDEVRPDIDITKPRTVEYAVGGRMVQAEVFTDLQDDHESNYCRNRRPEDGRCNIHGKHPFACDFELLRFLMMKGPRPNQLTTRLFGRGWNYTRVTGERGALCEITPASLEHKADVLRRMERLKVWLAYFGIASCVDEVLDYVSTGPHDFPVILPLKRRGFFHA